MHPNEELLKRLFDCLNSHDHAGMAECYDGNAEFRDIAFDLKGLKQIHAMWEMICTNDRNGNSTRIQATILHLTASDADGSADVHEEYVFRETRRTVRNTIHSHFEIRNGKIIRQVDECDPVCWARQAFGGIQGFVAGHLACVRRWGAMKKLKAFRREAFDGR